VASRARQARAVTPAVALIPATCPHLPRRRPRFTLCIRQYSRVRDDQRPATGPVTQPSNTPTDNRRQPTDVPVDNRAP
jgi:hypothetical protein